MNERMMMGMNRTNEPNRASMAEAGDIGSLLVPSVHRSDIRSDAAPIERRRFSFVGSGAMGTVVSRELHPPFCGDAGPMVWAAFDDGLCCLVSVASLVLY